MMGCTLKTCALLNIVIFAWVTLMLAVPSLSAPPLKETVADGSTKNIACVKFSRLNILSAAYTPTASQTDEGCEKTKDTLHALLCNRHQRCDLVARDSASDPSCKKKPLVISYTCTAATDAEKKKAADEKAAGDDAVAKSGNAGAVKFNVFSLNHDDE